MSSKDEVAPSETDQQVLACWNTLITTTYVDDIKHLKGTSDAVFGFTIHHSLIAKEGVLGLEFHENPTRTLELGTQVLHEQFEKYGVRMRPVIRVVEFGDEYLRQVDDLRMRDRNYLVSLDVKLNDISHPYGWLKKAVYECKDCGRGVVKMQRRARERESPSTCRPCLLKAVDYMKDDEVPWGLFSPRPNFKMILEECKYEDIQDISMRQITYNKDHHLIHCSSKNEIIGTVSDDLVGDLTAPAYVRVNGIVRVQPIPTRNFSKDTRRVLSIDVMSVEELPITDGLSS